LSAFGGQVLFWCVYFTKLAPIFKTNTNPRAEHVKIQEQLSRIRARGNPPRHRPRCDSGDRKTKFTFSFFRKKLGGRKNGKKRKGKFLVLRVRYNTPKRLANKFIAYAISLAVFPCLANLALTPFII
jgi:hypothetical protein